MRHPLLPLALVPVFFWAGMVQAQQVKSPAELFSAKTLGYAEIRHPGQLAKEIRSLFQGSVLANVPESLAKLRAKYDAHNSLYRLNETLGLCGLMLAPEVIAEAQRLQGAAIGLTGISQNGEPEFVAVILPGRSQAPSFFLRTAVMMARMRPSATVEGVTLYRSFYWGKEGRPDKRQSDDSRVIHESGPTVAMMPGILFIGSPSAVKDAIQRAKGKGKGASLAEWAGFQEALKQAGKGPGLFAFADVSTLWNLIEKQIQPRLRKGGREQLAALSKLVNPKAFRTVTYSYTLTEGTLRIRKVVLLNRKEKSPLMELFPTTPVNTEVLHFAPADAMFVAALSNGGGEKRAAQLLALADQVAKLGGQERELPSDMVKKMEEHLQIDLAKDVFGKIANVAFAVGDPLKAPMKRVVEESRDVKRVRSGPEIPMVFIVEATDKQAARKMVKDLLPRFVAMMAHKEAVKPTTKEINGHQIHTLQVDRHQDAVHYGRQGNVIVLGPYETPVAQALAAGADKKGWLASAKSADLLSELKDPVAVMAFKPITAAMEFAMLRLSSASAKRPVKGIEQRPPTKPLPHSRRKAISGEGKDDSNGHDMEADKIQKKLSKLLAKEEPLVASITLTEDRSVAEAKMGGLKPLVARLTDFVVEQMYQLHGSWQQRFEKKTLPRRQGQK
jgi:hypothetical protein